MSIRTAFAAAMAAGVPFLVAISMALNMSERMVGKSSNFKVGRCFGLREMVPVVGSMTMFCRLESAPVMTIPFVEPGDAIY